MLKAGIQVDIHAKGEYKNVGVQCNLLTSFTTSTPLKLRDQTCFSVPDSDLSDVDEYPAADISSSVYWPSQESSQS